MNSSIKTFFCPNETYNDMATLFFNPQESAILQLFHQDGAFLCARTSRAAGVFSREQVTVTPQPLVDPQTQPASPLILGKKGLSRCHANPDRLAFLPLEVEVIWSGCGRTWQEPRWPGGPWR